MKILKATNKQTTMTIATKIMREEKQAHRQIKGDDNYIRKTSTTRNRIPYFLLCFCLSLIPLRASREERDVCLLHVGMLGQKGCCTEIVSL